MSKLVLPAQDVRVDTPQGVDPIWYEKLQVLTNKMNVLDAFVVNGGYSEAVYTPVLSSSGGTLPTFVATPLTGRYFKMGRMVTVRIVANNTAGGTPGSGAFQLSVSLPLRIAASAIAGRLTAGMYVNSTTEGVLFADSSAGLTTAKLYKLGSASNQVTMDCADLNNVTRGLQINFTYPTD